MLAILLALTHAADLPDPGRSYTLELSVDPESREVDGLARIRFANPSEVPVERIPVHLFVNAYASGVSTWMTDDRGLRRSAFDEYTRLKESDDGWGWTTLESVTASGPDGPVDIPWAFIAPEDGNPHDRSLVELRLPQPVAPGEVLELTIDFLTRLPEMSPRTGVADDFVLVGHAVPTLAMMELPSDVEGPAGEQEGPRPHRWHAHQHHGQTEFFTPFADYHATITAPEGWLVDGTGTVSPSDGLPDDGVWTLTQGMVHDFSFVVVKDMEDRWLDHAHPDGRTVRVHGIGPTDRALTTDRVLDTVDFGLAYLGEQVGPYPYDTLTVVVPPEAAEGSEAIEYATLFLAQNAGTGLLERPLFESFAIHEMVAAHELAHQWFQGVVATDEIEHGWLDEGFTDYWCHRLMEEKLGGPSMGSLLGLPLSAEATRSLYGHTPHGVPMVRDPVWTSPTYLYDRGHWALHAYARMSLNLHTLDRVFGREATAPFHKAWFAEGRFRHPGPDDLLQVARTRGSPEMGALLQTLLTEAADPDLEVDRVSTWERLAPVGHVPTDDGTTYISEEEREDHPADLALPFEPDVREGQLTAELTQGGRGRRAGGVTRVRASVELGEDHDPEGTLHLSRVRLEGPGWKTLPVETVLHFEDGTVVRHTVQTDAIWWEYRVLHPSPLVRAEVDPEHTLARDLYPENNAMLVTDDTGTGMDWELWSAALLSTLGSSVGWWL